MAERLSFPEEKALSWLPILLDAYWIADRGVERAIEKRVSRGERLACRKGCANCCETHVTIPVYPLELVGIYWYAIERISREDRAGLIRRLKAHRPGDPCPFLLEGACSIHPMRPLACRHFNVFNRPCAPGEDPYYTRKGDVLQPDEEAKLKAMAAMLRFHGIRGRKARLKAARAGALNLEVRNLCEVDWPALATRMEGALLKGSARALNRSRRG